jgi:hypothetical protein
MANYELENMRYVDGDPEKCETELATFYAVYWREPPDPVNKVRVATWVADVATRDDAEFITKCLEARFR